MINFEAKFEKNKTEVPSGKTGIGKRQLLERHWFSTAHYNQSIFRTFCKIQGTGEDVYFEIQSPMMTNKCSRKADHCVYGLQH
jgi:hypothetical protein